MSTEVLALRAEHDAALEKYELYSAAGPGDAEYDEIMEELGDHAKTALEVQNLVRLLRWARGGVLLS